MVAEVRMPKLGAIMTEGIIVEWLKEEGEAVQKGETLLMVETEKVSVEVPSEDSGVLLKIVATEGTEAPVGDVIGYIGEPGETPDEVEPKSTAEAPTPAVAPQRSRGRSSVRASPMARKLARERGIDLSQVAGSGPRGSIVAKDLEGLAEAGGDEVVSLAGRRKTIAERMVRSYSSAPHVTLALDVDMSVTLQVVDRLREEGVQATLTGVMVAAVAAALAKHGLANSVFQNGKIRKKREIHVGVASDTEEGLVVPVIRDADKKNLSEISRELAELVAKARSGDLSVDDVTGGTFTISNLGMFGVEWFTPIINPPQAAILGIGRVRSLPSLREGKLVEVPACSLSLSFDHRILDGAQAARFLADVKEFLETKVSMEA